MSVFASSTFPSFDVAVAPSFVVARVTTTASLRSSDVLWTQDHEHVIVALERRDAQKQPTLWGSATAKICFTRTGATPSSGDWVAADVGETVPYVGARAQYTLEYTLSPGSVPGVGTLVAGREYSLWILIEDGSQDSRILVATVLAK